MSAQEIADLSRQEDDPATNSGVRKLFSFYQIPEMAF
jgi:hypothetical protein